MTPTVLDETEFADELAPGTPLLQGQYVIEAHLNSGGFGITYLAKDSLHRRVVIKECFPGSLCRRSKMIVGIRTRAHAKEFRTIVDLFVQEARQLARLRHPNIVGVHQVFLDNETAYMALDYVEGRDLLEIVESDPGRLTPKAIQDITIKLLDAIEFIHTEGVLHRDISPDNILISRNMEPVLIDFGAARETATRATRHLGAMRTVKDGYSPQEFYLSDAAQHPSSDLYSLGASLYHVMTGHIPPNAQERLAAVASGDPDLYIPVADCVSQIYPPAFLDAIDKALSVFPKHRIQSAAEWRAMITHTRISSSTRGTVSRPMLAVDNGNVVAQIRNLVQGDQIATEQDLQDVGLMPEKSRKMPVRKPRADEVSVSAEGANDATRSTGSKGLIAAAVVLVAVAGGAAFFTLGGSGDVVPGEETVASADTPAASAPAPEVVEAPAEATTASLAEPEASDTPLETTTPAQAEPDTTGQQVSEAPAPVAEPEADAPAAEPATEIAAVAPDVAPNADEGLVEPQLSEGTPSAAGTVLRPAARPNGSARTTAAAPIEPEVPAAAPAFETEVADLPAPSYEETDVRSSVATALNLPRTAPSIAALPRAEELPQVDATAPARLAREDATAVIDVVSVISGTAVDFPFEVDADDTTLIVAVNDGAPEFLVPGTRLISINGFPVESLADAQKAVKAMSDLRIGSDVEITLGLSEQNGAPFVRQVSLPTVQETFLLNGVRFRTENIDGTWKTFVVEAADRGEEGIRPGDQVVALMPNSEMIDKPGSLASIIERELAANVTNFNFAVNRGGEMYLVSMSYSGASN